MLADHGGRILARNVEIERGEIDLHVAFGRVVVAVEVKTLCASDPTSANPLRSYTLAKADQVHRLARRLRPRPHRIDVMAVVLHRDGVDVRWVRAA
jgi:Holliday junction resolvase-like predicted endonuclease